MSLIQPKQLAGQYYYITGSFSGDGTGLQGVTSSIYTGSISGIDYNIQYRLGNDLGSSNLFQYNSVSQSLRQGKDLTITGLYNHGTGEDNTISGRGSYVGGRYNTNDGAWSHVVGSGNYISSSIQYAFAGGSGSRILVPELDSFGYPIENVTNWWGFAFGNAPLVVDGYGFAIGQQTTSSRFGHSEGSYTYAGFSAHAEGRSAYANSRYSHAEGTSTEAGGKYVEPFFISASAPTQDEDGDPLKTGYLWYNTNDSLLYRYSGSTWVSQNDDPITLGTWNTSSATFSIITVGLGDSLDPYAAEQARFNWYSGYYSHAEGSITKALGRASHAEGYASIAGGWYSHAEGAFTRTGIPGQAGATEFGGPGTYSHAEGYQSIAAGYASHAEGYGTRTLGTASHAEGLATIASGSYQSVMGKYNTQNNTDSLVIIGGGTSNNNRQDLALFNSDSITFNQPITASTVSGSFIGDGSGLTGITGEGFVFPENYGAVGDGVTDDTNAIQSAFSASRALKNPIHLRGEYSVNQPIDVSNTIVSSDPFSKIISDTTDFVLFATGSRTTRYTATTDILRGYSTASINPVTLAALNLKQGDLIKVSSDLAFNTGSGESGRQGEIQRVFSTGSSGEIYIYGWWEDTYLISDGADVAKINSRRFETVGTLNVEQGGQSLSKGILLKYIDTPTVDVKVIGAIDRSLSVIDCYSPTVHVNNYGANRDGTGYGIAIGNSTMYGTFSGTSESNRHSITFGTDSDRGVGWGNKIVNFTGKAHTTSSIFDSHATCGSVYFDNCTAIGGFNRYGETVPTSFPNGFSIEGRTTYITNCNVKDCNIGASTGAYNGLQEIYIKGLNLDNCTIGVSAVGTEVQRLTIEDIDMYNPSFDDNSICVNIGAITSSFVNVKNIKSYEVRCGINLSNNNLVGGSNEFRIENLKTIYSSPSTGSSAFFSALRLYDENPVTLTNCETNAPRLVITDNGLNLKQLNLDSCKIYNTYVNSITLASPIENLNIQNCYFSGSQTDGYFLQSNSGANITNFTFIGNTLIGDGSKMRGAFVNVANTFTNFFDSGNTLNITTPTSINASGKQPDYWITEGNIYSPLKLKGTGSPEGSVVADIGTTFINLSGGAGTTLYIKESGTGNTGWVAK